ncbi:cytochrome P450 6A1-like [Anopheles ziemanni]|uniref:cytochrome P450 6A1-like n=1 Tax=Anopheles coustani TaxID=139045 RepID=UPI002659A13A|nr:cytochrome P450 6A1-like [Anopheles coustani]XP_058177507.1 cytochrome P450 6A1-like [Anopheles ziemanni]
MVSATSLLVALIVPFLTVCILFVRKRYTFWTRQGIPSVETRFPLGHIQHSSHLMVDLYRQLKGRHPFGGIFRFTEPVALVTDPKMVRNVIVRDFRYFYDRGGYANAAHDLLSGSLLNGEGKQWATIRQATVGLFSTVKLKAMYPAMVQMVDRFRMVLNAKLTQESEVKIDLKEWLSRLTVDIVSCVLLGIEANSLNDQEGGLYGLIGRQTFLVPKLWELFLMTSFRPLAKAIGLRIYPRELGELFHRMTQDMIEYRKKHLDVQRNDLVDRLFNLTKTDEGGRRLTEHGIAANVYGFLAAGYETTSTTVSYCLLELAKQPDLQERARKCAMDTWDKYGELTYESLFDMPYIDQCLNETLRKYPPGINIIRVVTEDYAVTGTHFVLRKGTHVIVPVYAIHHDEEYYPDPERFDPERFTPEACGARKPYTFLPYADGPKMCVAHRMGKMQVRLLLAMLLCRYRFEWCPETQIALSNAHTVIRMRDGLLVKVLRL